MQIKKNPATIAMTGFKFVLVFPFRNQIVIVP